MMHYLKQKNHIDGPISFSKSVLPINFRALWTYLTKPKANFIFKL